MDIDSLEGFDRIWARVQGSAAPIDDANDTLRRFLEQEAEGALFERCLARRCSALLPLWRCTCRRLSILRGLWFLRTGERFSPSQQCALQCDLAQDLRKDCLAVRDRARRYAAAAAQTDDEFLRAAYETLAPDARDHAEKLLCLLRQAL